MSIQQSINQAIGSTAAGLGVGKMLKSEAEKKLKQQQKMATKGEMLKQRAAKANENAKSIVEAKTEQKTKRRNFMKDYLPRMPVFDGHTIGEFDANTQKKIAQQFSKSQRKKIMDEFDKGGKTYGKTKSTRY